MPLCPVDVCDAQRLSHHLMCRRHWLMVPRDLQRKILNSWGVHGGRGAPRGSEEHWEACADAVETVNWLLSHQETEVRGAGRRV